jgi:hypothetical protein
MIATPARRAVVRQQSAEDCMACALAMFAGRSYDEVTAAARRAHPTYRAGDMMPHSLLRRVAHGWGLALLSSIYMDWRFPGIVGVLSRTIESCGHALYWDGAELIDPSGSGLYDRAYVDANAVEFTQRASHLQALIALEQAYQPAAPANDLNERF